MSIKLKPCPHGKEARILNIGGKEPFSVLALPNHRCVQVGFFARRDKAITAWNASIAAEPRPADSGMVEKVARAISAKRHELIGLPPPHWKGGEIWNKVDVVLTPAERDRYRQEARAAITAYNPNENQPTADAYMASNRALNWRNAQLRAYGIEPLDLGYLGDDAPHYPPDDYDFGAKAAQHNPNERLREALDPDVRRRLESVAMTLETCGKHGLPIDFAMLASDIRAALARTSPSGLRE